MAARPSVDRWEDEPVGGAEAADVAAPPRESRRRRPGRPRRGRREEEEEKLWHREGALWGGPLVGLLLSLPHEGRRRAGLPHGGRPPRPVRPAAGRRLQDGLPHGVGAWWAGGGAAGGEHLVCELGLGEEQQRRCGAGGAGGVVQRAARRHRPPPTRCRPYSPLHVHEAPV